MVALAPAAWVTAVLFGAGVVNAMRRRAPDHAVVWALAGFGGILLQNATFAAVTSVRPRSLRPGERARRRCGRYTTRCSR